MKTATAFLALAAAAQLLAAPPLAAQEGGSLVFGGAAEGGALAAWTWSGDQAPWSAADGSWTVAAPGLVAATLSARGGGGAVAASAGARLELAFSAGRAGASTRLASAWTKLDWGWASLELGRQPLTYGRMPLWSPIDLYAALDSSGLTPARLASDALRLRLPFGATGMADLVAAAPQEVSVRKAFPSDSAEAAALRPLDPGLWSSSLRVSALAASGLDLGALVQRDGLPADLVAAGLAGAGEAAWRLGADFKADPGPSIYGELLWSIPEGSIVAARPGEGRLRAAAGADWSAGDFMFGGEYYWNGGLSSGADPWLAGVHNVYASASWTGADYLMLSASLAWGITQGTGMFQLLAGMDAAQDARLSLYGRAGRSVLPGGASWSLAAGIDLTLSF